MLKPLGKDDLLMPDQATVQVLLASIEGLRAQLTGSLEQVQKQMSEGFTRIERSEVDIFSRLRALEEEMARLRERYAGQTRQIDRWWIVGMAVMGIGSSVLALWLERFMGLVK